MTPRHLPLAGAVVSPDGHCQLHSGFHCRLLEALLGKGYQDPHLSHLLNFSTPLNTVDYPVLETVYFLSFQILPFSQSPKLTRQPYQSSPPTSHIQCTSLAIAQPSAETLCPFLFYYTLTALQLCKANSCTFLSPALSPPLNVIPTLLSG